MAERSPSWFSAIEQNAWFCHLQQVIQVKKQAVPGLLTTTMLTLGIMFIFTWIAVLDLGRM